MKYQLKKWALLLGITLFLEPGEGSAVTQPYYHTFAVARVEALVVRICVVAVPSIDTNAFMEGRSRASSERIRETRVRTSRDGCPRATRRAGQARGPSSFRARVAASRETPASWAP